MADAERLRTLVTHLGVVGDGWNQSGWGWRNGCHTKMCAAGWTVALFAPERMIWTLCGVDEWHLSVKVLPGDQPDGMDPGRLAATLLDLNSKQKNEIFFWADDEHDEPTLDDFRELITSVTGVTFDG